MMRKKKFVSAVAIIIGTLVSVLAAGWLLVDDSTLITVLERRLESISDTRMQLSNARVTRSLSPTLSVEQLVIEDSGAQFRVDISALQIQFSALKLFQGKLDIPFLKVGDSSITLLNNTPGIDSSTQAAKVSKPKFTPLRFKPILHHVELGKLALIREGEEVHIPSINVNEIKVSLDHDADTPSLTAQINSAGDIFDIEVVLPKIHSALRKQVLDIVLSARNSSSHLSANGQIGLKDSPAKVDARIRLSANDLSKISTGVSGLVIPGSITADMQLSGSVDQLTLGDLSANWKENGDSELKITGGIGDVSRLEGMQLKVVGKIGKASWLKPALPENMGTLESVDVETQIVGSYEQFSFQDSNLHAVSQEQLDLTLKGQADVIQTDAGSQFGEADLKLAFSAPTTHAARVLLFDQVPELGAIIGNASIHAIRGVPALQDIVVRTKDAEGIDVDVSGSIARMPLDPKQPNSGYDLNVVMRSTNTELIAKRLGIKAPLSGPLNIAYRIEGDTQALALKQINLSAGEAKSLEIGVQGELLFGDWRIDDPLKNVDLMIQASSRDTKSIGSLMGQKLPEFGALNANARLYTADGKHKIDDLRIQTRKDMPVNVILTGSISDIRLVPQIALQGMQLKANASAADSARLNAIFELRDEIPAIGPFKASAVITGDNELLIIKDVVATAGQSKALLVNAKGELGRLSAADHWHPKNADLNITATSSDSSAFAKTLGYHTPQLGPIMGQAKISGKNNSLGIESALVQVGNKGAPIAVATGFIEDLFGAGKTRWDVKLDMDGHTLAAFADKQKLPDLGPLVGTMVIDNNDGSLGIKSLDVKSSQSELLNIAVNGRFDDFKKRETLSFDMDVKARDLQLVGALFDQTWPAIGPVKLNSSINSKSKGSDVVAALSAGDLQVDATISTNFQADPPIVNGKITAHELFFPDLFEETVEIDKKDTPKKSNLFSTTPMDFAWLRKADLNLTVDIQSFDKNNSKLESAQIVIAQKSGHLTIKPAIFNYPKGRLDIGIDIDANKPPQFNFTAKGNNLNPWQTLDIQQSSNDFDTDLDIDVTIKTSGESQHDLAANANGNIYMNMVNGKMRRELVDLVFVDVVGWTIGKTARDKYYDIDCGVADYSVEDGVLKTNALLLDSKNIAISGDGTIDLAQEKIDVVLLPKKKSRLISRADPVKITGSLTNPTVSAIPWKSAAATYGGMVFAPYIFVGITAVDYISSAIGIGSDKPSPCLEYEKRNKSRFE